MPTYEFQTKDGQVLSAFMLMSKAPPIGSWRKIEGKRAKRIVSRSAPEVQSDIKPYVSYSIPKNYPGCAVNSKGFSVVNSRAHELAIAKNEGF
jgi:hypothetical protein